MRKMNARRQRLLDAMAAAKNAAKELIQVLDETDDTLDGLHMIESRDIFYAANDMIENIELGEWWTKRKWEEEENDKRKMAANE